MQLIHEGWVNLLVCPYWGDQVDDEEIVRVEEETDTTNSIEFHVPLGHDPPETSDLGVLVPLIIFLCQVSLVSLDELEKA